MSPERVLTEDTLFNGRLKCVQHRYGYRFSLDAVLLANFISPKKSDKILDLGGGCGIISLILAYRHNKIQITSLELQADLIALAHRNVELNEGKEGVSSKNINIINGDFCSIDRYIQTGSYDFVISNPPYRKIGTGKINPLSEKAVARHEIDANLPEIIKAAAFSVKNRGKIAIIYPSTRTVSLIHEMKINRLEPKRLQVVYSFPGSEAKLVLVESVKGGGEGLKILEPFYIYKKSGGGYSDEMSCCYAP